VVFQAVSRCRKPAPPAPANTPKARLDYGYAEADYQALAKAIGYQCMMRFMVPVCDLVFIKAHTMEKTSSGKIRRHDPRDQLLDPGSRVQKNILFRRILSA
jgi:hypothetical protein